MRSAVAPISNASGSREAIGLSEGMALITANLGGVTSTSAQLTVMPMAPQAPIVQPRQNQIASLQLSPEAFALGIRPPSTPPRAGGAKD